MKRIITLSVLLLFTLLPLAGGGRGMFFFVEAPQIYPDDAEQLRDSMRDNLVATGRSDLLPVDGEDFFGLIPEGAVIDSDSFSKEYLVAVHLKLLELSMEETLVEVPPKRKKIYEEGGVARPDTEPEFRVDHVLFKARWSLTFWYEGNEITLKDSSFGDGPTREAAWRGVADDVAEFIQDTLITFNLYSDDRIIQILNDRSRIAQFSESHTRGSEFFLRGYTEDGNPKNYGVVRLLGDVEAGNAQEVAPLYHSPRVGFELVKKSNWKLYSEIFTTIPLGGNSPYTLTQGIFANKSKFLFNTTFLFGIEGVFQLTGREESASPWSSLRGVIGMEVFSANIGEARFLATLYTGLGYRWNSDWQWYAGSRFNVRTEFMPMNHLLLSLNIGYEYWGPFTLKEYETSFYSGLILGVGFGYLL